MHVQVMSKQHLTFSRLLFKKTHVIILHLLHSHHIQSTGCWRLGVLCRGLRRCEKCGVSCCSHRSGSLSPGPYRGLRFDLWVRGSPPRSDGAARRSGGAPGAAAPPPKENGWGKQCCALVMHMVHLKSSTQHLSFLFSHLDVHLYPHDANSVAT